MDLQANVHDMRTQMAERLRHIPGLVVFDEPPTASGMVTGSCWVQFAGFDPEPWWTAQWRIVAIVGDAAGGVQQADSNFSAWAPQAVAALKTWATITGVEPVVVPIGGADRPAMSINLWKEAY